MPEVTQVVVFRNLGKLPHENGTLDKTQYLEPSRALPGEEQSDRIGAVPPDRLRRPEA